jgi:hypothetical protein
MLTELEKLQHHNAAFIQAAYQGWFATALEQTKAVFTLSSAGVALSLTLLFSENVQPMESWAPVWLLLAALSFSISSGFSVAVFERNKSLVGKLLRDEEVSGDEAFVGRLDLGARFSFGAGLSFLLLAGVAQLWL